MRAMGVVKLLILTPIMGLSLYGCAAPRTESQAKSGISLVYFPEYSIVLAPMTSVSVSSARAYRVGDEFIVSGRVKRLHKVPLPGHIDLAICSPDGVLLAHETRRIPGLASNRKGVLELPFRFHLYNVPPKGATIRLQYHPLSSENEDPGCKIS